MYLFENLDIYNDAVTFVALVELETKSFPHTTDYFVKRVNQAARSIQKNIAEAHAQVQIEKRKESFWQVVGAIQECSGLIEIAGRQGLIELEKRNFLLVKLANLSQAVRALIRGSEPELKPTTTPFSVHV